MANDYSKQKNDVLLEENLRLQAENQTLKAQLRSLKTVSEQAQKMKQMISELSNAKDEYHKRSMQLKSLQTKYRGLVREAQKLRNDLQSTFDELTGSAN